MKTFDHIRTEYINRYSIRKITMAMVDEAAAKEYAKQWIDEAATIAKMYAGLNAQYAIEDLKIKIDAHGKKG